MRLNKDDKSKNKNIRLKITIIILSILSFLVFFKYAALMTKNAKQKVYTPKVNLQKRGNIYDRNGKLIAFSTKTYSLGTFPENIKNIVNTAETLGAILEIDPETLKENFSQKKGFLYIERKIPLEKAELIKKIQKENRLEDIFLYKEYKRIYPFRELTSNITGFVGTDNFGLEGIEFTLNSTLMPSATQESSINSTLKPNNVYLTIDLEMQNMLFEVSKEYFKENNPEKLLATIMDAKSGEILATVQFPNYDANFYNEYPSKTWENSLVSMVYEPGSVFKVFTVAGILNTKRLKKEEKFLDNGIYKKEFNQGEVVIIRTLQPPNAYINTEGILVHSSNVGIAYITEKVTNNEFYEILTGMGFYSKTELPFPGESRGILNHPNKWSGRSKATIGFGQEIGVNSIQILKAATALSNEGVMLKPQIIKKITMEDESLLKEFKKEEIKRVFSREVAKDTLKMMRSVVENGSSRRAKVKGINISAKTGTAQIINEETGKYSEEDFTASILAIYPTEDPKYIIYIVYRYPKKLIYGSRIAAPMVKDIVENLEGKRNLKYKTINIEKKEIKIQKKKLNLENSSILPNFKGLSKRDLIKALNKLNLKAVKIEGEGHVYSQSEPAQKNIKDIESLTLKLR